MSKPLLVIGNKNYSSWSLRAWLMLKHAGINFDEMRISLFVAGYKEKLFSISPANICMKPISRCGLPTGLHGLVPDLSAQKCIRVLFRCARRCR
jgi:hypothetical protein